MIVGLSGPNGAGKGEVVAFLTRRGFLARSLSDALRAEVRARGGTVTRRRLLHTGNRLRRRYGAGVLAERVLHHLHPEKHYVIDSIRHPEEVRALRQRRDFTLLWIDARPTLRFGRLRARGREADPATWAAFRRLEAVERGGRQTTDQHLGRVRRIADRVVLNNGAIAALHRQIGAIVMHLATRQPRPDWDAYFLGLAQVVALRSNCVKRRVAAVLVKDQRVISTGYNGTPRGVKNCNEGGCPRCRTFGEAGTALADCLCSHAEENAITQAAYHGVSIKGATLYTTFSPCLMCTKMIINSGLAEVVYTTGYAPDQPSRRLLREAGIRLRQLPETPSILASVRPVSRTGAD